MFSTVMIVLLILAAIGALVVSFKLPREQHGHQSPYRAIARAASGGLAVLALVLFGFSVTYTQDVGEAKVIKSFTGEIKDVDTTAGIGTKAPWDSAIDFDVRNQVVVFTPEETNNGGPIVAQDKDQNTATIDAAVTYDIVPSETDTLYADYGPQENLNQALVVNKARSVLRNSPGVYTTNELRSNRGALAETMKLELEEVLDDYGITVVAVDLRNISYPPEIEQSFLQIQTKRAEAEAARAELDQANIRAETTRVEAQAAADADQIVRCGATTAQVEEMVNGVMTKVTRTTPLQGAECQNRLNEQVLASKYIDMLTEAAAKGNTFYVVPPDGNQIMQLPAPAPRQ